MHYGNIDGAAPVLKVKHESKIIKIHRGFSRKKEKKKITL